MKPTALLLFLLICAIYFTQVIHLLPIIQKEVNQIYAEYQQAAIILESNQ